MELRPPIPILSPKLQIPPSRLHLVSRQRLLDALDGGLHRKLTLISAPAGYGKTTLLSDWASQCEWPVAWVTLAGEDNDTDRFLTYLVAALQTAAPDLSGLKDILGARLSPQPIPQDAILAILVNELASSTERLVVVLDDYHVIESQEIHDFLGALLDLLPPMVHMVIATRSDPPVRTARWRAKDQLNEITESDLRFTGPEAQSFLVDVMGLSLTSDQVADLEVRTEGWVTGLQLVSLSLKEREQPDALIKALDGTHRYILDYLVEEVFDDLPAVLQAFLLRVSILQRLSPGLCDAVASDLADEMGTPLRSKQILEFMDASNLFVVPLDNQRQWYRFHSLFAEFLQDRLALQDTVEVGRLHRLAATWHADHGLLAEAVHHCFAGRDFDHAADLVERQVLQLLGGGEISIMLRWIEALPEETVDNRPRLGLARAWAMLMRAPVAFWKTYDRQIHQIAKGLGIAPKALLSALAESEPETQRRALLGELAMLQAYVGRDIADAEETIQLFKAAHECLPKSEQLLRGFNLAGLASTYARVGALELAEEAFAEAAQISLAEKSVFGYVACTDWQATMQAERGHLVQAAATHRRAIEALASQGGRPLPLSGHVHVALASVLLEWNDLTAALEAVETGLAIGNRVGDMDALLDGYAIQARVLLALSRESEAMAAMQRAEQQALNTGSSRCALDAQARKAMLALSTGDIAEARRWAAARGLLQDEPGDLEHPLAETELFAYARLLMAEGSHARALPILGELLDAREAMGGMRAVVELLALQALCYRATRRMDDALRALARALLLAEPEGFERVFIEGGQPMAALLRAAGAQGHAPAYVKRLLARFAATPAEKAISVEALSERELEVLHLIGQGLTNAEIAAKLVIAQSTVKTHINHIYSKLGVRTRTLAVARARERQILP